jgi:hypothetical protein
VIIRRDLYFDESVPFLKTPVKKKAFEELIIPVYIRSRTTRSLEPPPAMLVHQIRGKITPTKIGGKSFAGYGGGILWIKKESLPLISS